MKRREFLQGLTGAVAVTALPRVSLGAGESREGRRPNILWVSCEDTSPDLGCYGDSYAVTPAIDRLATEGVRYTNACTHAGVCAPARSGIITGMYPTTIGTHHMRCQGVPPPYVRCFTEYLRAAGYYCTNNSKTDYQFAAPLTAWDQNSRQAHWRGRGEEQPFFSVFNFTTSHESQIRNFSKKMQDRIANLEPHEKHDPAKAVLPPYYPDTPKVRRDWAQYYDVVTLMDKQVGEVLKQLEDDGLADDTIVWFWGDHGRGLPRGKRWIYDSGILIPLIVRAPEKWRKHAMPGNPDALKPGTVNDDLVAFIDFGPTVLSLADVDVPDYVQGRPFLGAQKAPPREYIFAARDRMDEAFDLIRAVRDKRYKYIRNYMAYVSRGQDINYMNQMPTMQEMRRLNAAGKLVGPQKQYFEETKPVEELYDTVNDPHEVHNLAGDPQYRDTLERMRKVHLQWTKETGDVGLIPEAEFDEMKRPGAKWETTAAPTFSRSGSAPSGKGAAIAIACATPGALIAWKIGGNDKSGWELYTKPVALKPGQVLRAKANRIGFRDSDEAQFKVGDSAGSSQKVEVSGGTVTHWRERLDKTDLLERLRAIKALDGSGAKAIPRYLEALNDSNGSARYWGVVGLHNASQDNRAIRQARKAVAGLLKDPSPIVRIAAAEAMCDWNREKRALPVLVEALQHDSNSVRHSAAVALGRIGDKARPALPQLKAATKDSYRYVGRTVGHILRRLEGGSK